MKKQLLQLVLIFFAANAYSQQYVGSMADSEPAYIPGSMAANGSAILYGREWIETGGYRFAL